MFDEEKKPEETTEEEETPVEEAPEEEVKDEPIEKGHPVTEILKVEKDEEVSAIVMGSHGRNNIVEALIGTVSEKVVRRAATPVLLVKR